MTICDRCGCESGIYGHGDLGNCILSLKFENEMLKRVRNQLELEITQEKKARLGENCCECGRDG